MLTIYVCDDSLEQAQLYCNIINKYLLFKDWDTSNAQYFTSPMSLLKTKRDEKSIGLYFLDIDLKTDLDGFSLAKKIRELDPRGFLVFLTAHDQYIPLTFQYRVEAMDYIIKSDKSVDARIKKCINEAYTRYQLLPTEQNTRICLKSNGRTIFLSQTEIIYITTSTVPHQLQICTINSVIYIYGKLKDYENQLGSKFVRIHKNCIVNRDCIKEINYQTQQVHMQDGSILQVSYRCMKNLTL